VGTGRVEVVHRGPRCRRPRPHHRPRSTPICHRPHRPIPFSLGAAFPTQHGLRWLHSPTKPEPGPPCGFAFGLCMASAVVSWARQLAVDAAVWTSRVCPLPCEADKYAHPLPSDGCQHGASSRHQDEGDNSHGIPDIYTNVHSPSTTSPPPLHMQHQTRIGGV